MSSRPFSLVTAQAPHNLAAQSAVGEVKQRRHQRRVTVLMGGLSSEREVSLNSGANAVQALEQAGYAVKAVDVSRDLVTLARDLEKTAPDVVFNALHGRYGEDGCLQGVLNLLALPYTHSGLLASALAMDKPAARRLFAESGLNVAQGKVVTREELLVCDPLRRPYVVKPLNEGSSVGVVIVREEDPEPYFANQPWPYGDTVLVEAFIPGREFTVAVMGQGDDCHALGVTEIHTDRVFYDYEAKYAAGGSIHTLPADLPEEIYADCQRQAILAHQSLGCRGVSRTDLRYDGEKLVILEVNTQPGMTKTSLVPEQAALAGISFPDLCVWMVETAECDR